MADMPEMKTFTSKDKDGKEITFEVVDAKAREEIANLRSGGTEVCPYEEVSSIEEMTDTSKQYLMNGYVYSYVATSGVEVPDFTNLAKITDTDTRLNSSGGTTALTGHAVQDWIDCVQGDVIRVKGLNILHDVGYVQIYTTEAKDGSKPTSYPTHFTTDSDGVISFTVATWISTSTQPTITKLRMSGEVTGSVDDIIITKNEEIAYRVTDGTYEWVQGEKWESSSSTSDGSTSSGTTTEEVTVPDYWQDHLDSKIATVKALQDTAGDELVSFPNFTDLHCNANQSYNLGRNIGILSKEIMKRCNLPFAVCDGDTNPNGNLSTKDAVETCLENAMEIFAPIIDDLLLARGNHDITYGGSSTDGNAYQWQYSPSELYNKLFRWQATDFRRVFDTESDGTYFYVDNKAQKTRFIILDSQWVEWQGRNEDGTVIYNGHHNSGYGQRQLEWLANKALQFDETGWIGVIVTHVPPTSVTYNGTTRDYLSETRDGVIFKEIVNAFCNKTTYTGTYTGTDEWQNVDISVDFTSRNGNVACILCGHCHCDRIIEGELPCPIITFTSASDMARTGEESEDRVFGTITETAFDVVSIDRVNHKIYMTRVGIGSDRECSYSPEVLPNTLIPPTTVDFSEEQWIENGGYVQESTFMFDTTKSYKVIWDGVEYVVDVMDMSDDTATIYAVGNLAVFELEDNGLPFTLLTMNDADVGMVFGATNWAYMSGAETSPISTFSVEEYVEEEPLVYKCTVEMTDVEGTEYPLLKGISIAELKQKDRMVELDSKLYTSSYAYDNDDILIYLNRFYAQGLMGEVYKEAKIFAVDSMYPTIILYMNTITGKLSITDVTAEKD